MGIGEEDPPDSNEDMDEVDEVDPELDCGRQWKYKWRQNEILVLRDPIAGMATS